MKDTYTLVGLDDKITLRDVQNLTLNDLDNVCLKLNEFEKPISTDVLFNVNGTINHAPNQRLWGRMLQIDETTQDGVNNDVNFGKPKTGDPAEYMDFVFNGGGIFQDKVGNMIVAVVDFRNLSKNQWREAVGNGYFGNPFPKKNLLSYKGHRAKFQQSNSSSLTTGSYLLYNKAVDYVGTDRMKDQVDGIKKGNSHFRKMLEDSSELSSIIDKENVGVPIILNLYKSDKPVYTLNQFMPLIEAAVTIAGTFIGIPPNVTMAAFNVLKSYKNGEPINVNDAATVLNEIGVGESKYVKDALAVGDALQKGDKNAIANYLGEKAKTYGNDKISKYLDENQVQLLDGAITSTMTLTKRSEVAQNYRDNKVIEQSLKSRTTSSSSAYQEVKNSDVKNSKYLQNLFVMMNGKGKSQLLMNSAVTPNGETMVKELLNKPEMQKPEYYFASMKGLYGVEPGENVMNAILLEQIENNIKTNNYKNVVLPSGLKPETQECFKRYLQSKGISIYAPYTAKPTTTNKIISKQQRKYFVYQ
jgi:hypothetical protein